MSVENVTNIKIYQLDNLVGMKEFHRNVSRVSYLFSQIFSTTKEKLVLELEEIIDISESVTVSWYNQKDIQNAMEKTYITSYAFRVIPMYVDSYKKEKETLN